MALELRLPAALCAAFLLGGCDPQPDVPTRSASLGKLPAALCGKASESLAALADSAVFEHDGKGSAVLGEAVWMSMSSEAREQLARTLAVDAACKQSDAPRSLQVFIKAETGRTLASPVVDLAPGADMMFEDS
ncbi:MAG TPA: hypothetical protein VF655_10800 [Allosphingosinicella sp.]|jgi:hypothetical protein